MGRRPKEDNEEQRKRLEPDFSGCRGPSDHGRQRSGGAADDDVLSRGPLQPRRVHDNIEEDRAGQQCGCREVRRQSENHHCEDRQERVQRQAPRTGRPCPGELAASRCELMTASISASYHMLSTPAAPAPAAMARTAARVVSGSSRTGALLNPTSAVKTASIITRGFVRATKSDTLQWSASG